MSKVMFLRLTRELATMVRPGDWRLPVAVDRCLLIVAGLFRLSQLRMRMAVMAIAFIRYRLGIVSWQGWPRNCLWRTKRGLTQALG
jgi:hypothetical protein